MHSRAPPRPAGCSTTASPRPSSSRTWKAQSAVTMHSRVPKRTSLMAFSSFSKAIRCCTHIRQGRATRGRALYVQVGSTHSSTFGDQLLMPCVGQGSGATLGMRKCRCSKAPAEKPALQGMRLFRAICYLGALPSRVGA